jgi:hypothetical protein
MSNSENRPTWSKPLITFFAAIALTFGWIVLLDSTVLTSPAKHAALPSSTRSVSPTLGKFRGFPARNSNFAALEH